jgi:cysteinyl-tRNA synthetase
MHKHHYREPWEYHEASLEQAAALARLLRQAITARSGADNPLVTRGAVNSFTAAMDDDLDTPTALRIMEEFAEQIRRVAGRGRDVSQAQAALREMAAVFGLYLDATEPEERVTTGWNEHLAKFTDP